MHKTAFRALKQVQTHPVVGRVWLFTFIVVVIFIGFLFLPWQQTVKGEGRLVAYDPSERVQPVSATINGVIQAFHVGENQHVVKGEKLFTMADLDSEYASRVQAIETRLRAQLDNTLREVDAIEANRDNAVQQRATGIALFEQRRLQAQEQLESLRLRRDALQKQLETDTAHFERTRQLFEASIASRRSYEQADAAYVKAKTEREKIDVDLSVQERSLAILEREQTQFVREAENRIRSLENEALGARNRYMALERELERQKSEVARYATSDVRAQKDGEVVRIWTQDKNKFIRQGEPVMQFAPDVTERSILLKISDFNMPLLQEGLRVRMMFYGWPALQISGWPAIRFGTFGGIIKKVDPVSYEEGFYYAYITEDPDEPWPSGEKLRLGTQATVWVALETVPVWYQLWRQMNALPPKMATPEGPKS